MDPFASLRDGNEEEIAEVIQDEMIDISLENIHVIEDWIESGFRQRCILILNRLAPPGWLIEEEKWMGGSRADILITDPNGYKIMIELKYVRLRAVVFKDREEYDWLSQVNHAYSHVFKVANMLALEVDVYGQSEPMKIKDWLEAVEFQKCLKRPRGKFNATSEAMKADDAFLMVGVGARVFTCRPHEID